MTSIEATIDERIGEVRTDAFDLTFGEITNLHKNHEMTIQPEYQRLFRWSDSQRSRLIESILLELPIPPIFTIENENGVLELIDGLQRISSVLQFIEPETIALDPLRLVGCELIPDLNDRLYIDLPLSLRLRLKRSSIRTIIIKRQSKSFLKYEMFKRLNTGGSLLSPQEIRNCSVRMLGTDGTQFYQFLQELAQKEHFLECTQTLSQSDLDQRGDEELVLRFFALKNGEGLFKGSVRDWLDDYMESVLIHGAEFIYPDEERDFDSLFGFLAQVAGRDAFVKFRGTSPIGGLAPAYFEAVTMGTYEALKQIAGKDKVQLKAAIVRAVQRDDFRAVTGPGANRKDRLRRRIEIVRDALLSV
jgi:hypothetical protein